MACQHLLRRSHLCGVGSVSSCPSVGATPARPAEFCRTRHRCSKCFSSSNGSNLTAEEEAAYQEFLAQKRDERKEAIADAKRRARFDPLARRAQPQPVLPGEQQQQQQQPAIVQPANPAPVATRAQVAASKGGIPATSSLLRKPSRSKPASTRAPQAPTAAKTLPTPSPPPKSQLAQLLQDEVRRDDGVDEEDEVIENLDDLDAFAAQLLNQGGLRDLDVQPSTRHLSRSPAVSRVQPPVNPAATSIRNPGSVATPGNSRPSSGARQMPPLRTARGRAGAVAASKGRAQAARGGLDDPYLLAQLQALLADEDSDDEEDDSDDDVPGGATSGRQPRMPKREKMVNMDDINWDALEAYEALESGTVDLDTSSYFLQPKASPLAPSPLLGPGPTSIPSPAAPSTPPNTGPQPRKAASQGDTTPPAMLQRPKLWPGQPGQPGAGADSNSQPRVTASGEVASSPISTPARGSPSSRRPAAAMRASTAAATKGPQPGRLAASGDPQGAELDQLLSMMEAMALGTPDAEVADATQPPALTSSGQPTQKQKRAGGAKVQPAGQPQQQAARQGSTNGGSSSAAAQGGEMDWQLLEKLLLGEGWQERELGDLTRQMRQLGEDEAQLMQQEEQQAQVAAGGAAEVAPWLDEVTSMLLGLVALSHKRYCSSVNPSVELLLPEDLPEEERAAAVWSAPWMLLVQDDSREAMLEYANRTALSVLGIPEFADVYDLSAFDVVAPSEQAQQEWMWASAAVEDKPERKTVVRELQLLCRGTDSAPARTVVARNAVLFRVDSLEGDAVGMACLIRDWKVV